MPWRTDAPFSYIERQGDSMHTKEDIRETIRTLTIERCGLLQEARLVDLKIQQAQERCEHPENSVKRWTNNDGSGPFTVERCEVCGLQRDGGLHRKH